MVEVGFRVVSYASNAIQCLAIHKQADGTFVLLALFKMNCKQWIQLLIGPELTFFSIETKEVIEGTEKNTKTEIQMGHSRICLSLRYYNVEAASKFTDNESLSC